jgi:hypothetical protein
MNNSLRFMGGTLRVRGAEVIGAADDFVVVPEEDG